MSCLIVDVFLNCRCKYTEFFFFPYHGSFIWQAVFPYPLRGSDNIYNFADTIYLEIPMQSTFSIQFSPLQGYTDAIYRRAHALLFGGVDCYYSPFVRIEHGEIRRKDVRDIDPDNNAGVRLIPQLIASGQDKAKRIMEHFAEKGYREADLNLGCPFPMLAKRHNGAGMLPFPEEVEEVLTDLVERFPQIAVSVKLRLGWDDPQECLRLLPLLNRLPLSHIVLHLRLGKQQYKGETDMDAFSAFYEACEKPLFYNGDLMTVADIEEIRIRFPRLSGVVVGRGLLGNPALAVEYFQGHPLEEGDKMERVRKLHEMVFDAYSKQLQGGDAQLLLKMKAFWEYLLPDADRKARKAIHKATKLDTYRTAVASLLRG